jgi:hypothetical protein
LSSSEDTAEPTAIAAQANTGIAQANDSNPDDLLLQVLTLPFAPAFCQTPSETDVAQTFWRRMPSRDKKCPQLNNLGYGKIHRKPDFYGYPWPISVTDKPSRRDRWPGGQDSNLDSAISNALACSRGATKPQLIRIRKHLETFQFREPYQIGGVQSSGEK